MNAQPWHLDVVTPALLRHARNTYGSRMRRALVAAGYDDLPGNGLYIIGGLALGAGGVPLAQLCRELRLPREAVTRLIDTLLERGYLERRGAPETSSDSAIALSARGAAAAAVQAAARTRIDEELSAAVGADAVAAMRRSLAVLVDMGREDSPAHDE